MRNVTEGGDTFRTELACAGKVLPLAHMSNEANADYLFDGWFKIVENALTKHELKGVAMQPKNIQDADDFAAAILTSEKYAELYRNKL